MLGRVSCDALFSVGMLEVGPGAGVYWESRHLTDRGAGGGWIASYIGIVQASGVTEAGAFRASGRTARDRNSWDCSLIAHVRDRRLVNDEPDGRTGDPCVERGEPIPRAALAEFRRLRRLDDFRPPRPAAKGRPICAGIGLPGAESPLRAVCSQRALDLEVDVKLIAVTDNLIQLTRLRFVNAYLVREEDGFTLVDTTTGGAADALIAAAGRTGGEIRRIALTHGHGDHVGSLDALKERLGDSVQVLMPELDARIHAGEKVTEGKLPGAWPKLETVPDVRLVDGERVGSLEVVLTPGHTPGHVAFIDTRDGVLIAGDTFTAYGGLAVASHFYPRFPFAAMASWDKTKVLESAARLRSLDPAVLVVGHGPAVRDPGAAMDQAITGPGALPHERRRRFKERTRRRGVCDDGRAAAQPDAAGRA